MPKGNNAVCCDLLKKLYLCGINYNIVGKVNELIAL